MVCCLLSNGVSQLQSIRDLQTMSPFIFAKLILPAPLNPRTTSCLSPVKTSVSIPSEKYLTIPHYFGLCRSIT